jgi:type IV pilus assembly protein PilQ
MKLVSNTKKQIIVLMTIFCSFSTGIACLTSTVAHAQPIRTNLTLDDIAPNNKLLSFDFQSIDIRLLLQLIAKNSGLNFIIGDAVKGSVTLNLKNVTWQEALNIIVKTHGLASRKVNKVIFISTVDEITTNETKQLRSDEALASLAPLKTILIRLKYTNATNVAGMLKGSQGNLLTARGEVAVDTRTNTLIIRDTGLALADLKREITQLDVPARQVLIEARIVNIDTSYEEQLGVRFGMSDTRHLSGTLRAANEIVQGVTPGSVKPFTDRLNFNVPANALFDGSTPGSIGLALARVGHLLLDLELSALEGENHAQIISRPRVVTSNQEKAVIMTGEEIPYQESTSSGATSIVFKKAVLSLEIVPQITPNNKIILKMKATQDRRGENIAVGQQANNTPTTIPVIDTQTVESNILLENNETIVVGGVYKAVKINTMDRIPFFGSLPVVGHLFTHTGEHDEKHELLIFITPKIITAENHKMLGATSKLYKDEVLNKERN